MPMKKVGDSGFDIFNNRGGGVFIKIIRKILKYMLSLSLRIKLCSIISKYLVKRAVFSKTNNVFACIHYCDFSIMYREEITDVIFF